MAVLVTGGAGYIGSHMAWALIEAGERVVVLDNLQTGLRNLVPRAALFVRGGVEDRDLVRRLIDDHAVEAVMHFAGSTVVPESVSDPLKYYANNTCASRELITACVDGGVSRLVFSSTAAIYGSGGAEPVTEAAPKAPANPYGRSKLMTEQMLRDVADATPLRYVALRYFNVAGADPLGRSGQSTPQATHLIKRACQVALGRRPHLGVFGSDFDTPDGTGVRDYIHVSDLVQAHALALAHLRAGGASDAFNCGYGRGYSVREVARAVERASGAPLPLQELPRRPGDPASVVADSAKLVRELGWRPRHDTLDEIVHHALAGRPAFRSASAAASARRGKSRAPALHARNGIVSRAAKAPRPRPGRAPGPSVRSPCAR